MRDVFASRRRSRSCGGALTARLRRLRASPTARSARRSPVDVELVLAVDISYSMDPDELALQREGYIAGADVAGIHRCAAAAACTARSP